MKIKFLFSKLKQLFLQSLKFFKLLVETWHGRFTLLGLVLGLLYLPLWSYHLFVRSLEGSSVWPLILGFIGVGFWLIWKKRQVLSQLEATEADKLIGYLLIISSALFFPFCSFAVWPLSILWIFTLSGIVISSWGISFLSRFPLPVFLIGATAYPKPGIFARAVWEAMTPSHFLDKFMALSGAAGLQLLGLPAVAEGSLVILPPEGAVHVDWGCNGFSMACTIAVAGFFMGIFLKQRWQTVSIMTIFGAILALIFNIPRIMLLTVASIHWGEESFNFWHGPWGGQLFTGVLFTVYYYTVMAMIKRRPSKAA